MALKMRFSRSKMKTSEALESSVEAGEYNLLAWEKVVSRGLCFQFWAQREGQQF